MPLRQALARGIYKHVNIRYSCFKPPRETLPILHPAVCSVSNPGCRPGIGLTVTLRRSGDAAMFGMSARFWKYMVPFANPYVRNWNKKNRFFKSCNDKLWTWMWAGQLALPPSTRLSTSCTAGLLPTWCTSKPFLKYHVF